MIGTSEMKNGTVSSYVGVQHKMLTFLLAELIFPQHDYVDYFVTAYPMQRMIHVHKL